MLTALRKMREQMVADLMGRLRAGKITTRNLESQQRSRFRKTTAATEAVAEILMETAKAGKGHVRDELTRVEASLGVA